MLRRICRVGNGRPFLSFAPIASQRRVLGLEGLSLPLPPSPPLSLSAAAAMARAMAARLLLRRSSLLPELQVLLLAPLVFLYWCWDN